MGLFLSTSHHEFHLHFELSEPKIEDLWINMLKISPFGANFELISDKLSQFEIKIAPSGLNLK